MGLAERIPDSHADQCMAPQRRSPLNPETALTGSEGTRLVFVIRILDTHLFPSSLSTSRHSLVLSGVVIGTPAYHGTMSTAPRLASAKRDWGHDETGCTVLHIDMDAFYASCEIARHPELKGKPVIIGTGTRSVVSAASYEARPYGVNSAMPVSRARRLCPQGIFLPVDMPYYRSVSHRIFETVFSHITDQIEQVSVDECFMDVSGALMQWGMPTAIARWIRATVARNFNVTCSVGIATNKLVAKMASTNAKPNGMLLIPKARQADFVRLMPLRGIPGIGPALEKRLNAWAIRNVADLAKLSEHDLVRATGSEITARMLYLSARGQDQGRVHPRPPEKSIGAERTFLHDTTSMEQVCHLLRTCSDEVATSLRAHDLIARTITVKLRFDDLRYMTKAKTLEMPVNSANRIYPQAVVLLKRMLGLPDLAPMTTPLPRLIRLAGVSASGLGRVEETPIQPSLEDVIEESSHKTGSGTQRMDHAEAAMDTIRNRYGKGAVKLGV